METCREIRVLKHKISKPSISIYYYINLTKELIGCFFRVRRVLGWQQLSMLPLTINKRNMWKRKRWRMDYCYLMFFSNLKNFDRSHSNKMTLIRQMNKIHITLNHILKILKDLYWFDHTTMGIRIECSAVEPLH